jgi:hypothetical protein
MTIHIAESFMGSGDVLAAVKNGSTWGNYANLGNVDKFELKADAERKDQTTKQLNMYGQITDSVIIGKPHTIELSVKSLSKTLFTALFLGSVTEITSGSGAGTYTSSNAFYAGDSIVFTSGNITSLYVTGGGDVMAAGTDYTAHTEAGYITLLTDAATGITAGFNYPAVTGYQVSGATNPTFIMRFIFIGENMASGRRCKVTVDEAWISPKTPFDFLGNDYVKGDFSGSLKTVSGATRPYVIEYFD